jgi:hypothetical protein
MINKRNWKLYKAYLADRLHVDQISLGSWNIEQSYLRYLLEWADSTPFSKVPAILPTYPEFIRSLRDEKTGKAFCCSRKKAAGHGSKVLSLADRE